MVPALGDAGQRPRRREARDRVRRRKRRGAERRGVAALGAARGRGGRAERAAHAGPSAQGRPDRGSRSAQGGRAGSEGCRTGPCPRALRLRRDARAGERREARPGRGPRLVPRRGRRRMGEAQHGPRRPPESDRLFRVPAGGCQGARPPRARAQRSPENAFARARESLDGARPGAVNPRFCKWASWGEKAPFLLFST